NPSLIAKNPEVMHLVESGHGLTEEQEASEYKKIVQAISPLVGEAGVSIEVFAADEGLLVPFYVNGKAVGTIWAVVHDNRRKFDAEDLRLLESMSRFASAAYQAVLSIEAGNRGAPTVAPAFSSSIPIISSPRVASFGHMFGKSPKKSGCSTICALSKPRSERPVSRSSSCRTVAGSRTIMKTRTIRIASGKMQTFAKETWAVSDTPISRHKRVISSSGTLGPERLCEYRSRFPAEAAGYRPGDRDWAAGQHRASNRPAASPWSLGYHLTW